MKLREMVRNAAEERLDLKPFEADMRHLLDKYVTAEAPRKISPFDGIGLVELIVKTGIAAAIAERLGNVGSRAAVAETIENNVRAKIVTEMVSDPAFYEKMSELLDEVIRFRKERAEDYEEYLRRIADIVGKVGAGVSDETPKQLDTPGKRALFNNLGSWIGRQGGVAGEIEAGVLGAALRIDARIRSERPDDWRGSTAKENAIRQLLWQELGDKDDVERIFLIVRAQGEY
ncbi:MAG: hypothetical protein H0V89_06450 [Deltaproteobacteria bacterium]|nr:hypothetical protein [Deltaproteobacteria bacterium]